MLKIANTRDTVNFGIVGFGWMGQVHAKAISRVLQHFPDLGLRPQLVGVADRQRRECGGERGCERTRDDRDRPV